MPQTWGVPVEEIQRGIKHGVRKINIDTDNRMAMTALVINSSASGDGTRTGPPTHRLTTRAEQWILLH